MTATTEKRIPVAIPDGYEFDRFDAETGEAVYCQKVRPFEVRLPKRFEKYLVVSDEGVAEVRFNNFQEVAGKHANAFNLDVDKSRAERRAAFFRAWNKLAYIADELNPAGWEPTFGGKNWTPKTSMLGPQYTENPQAGAIYFHSRDAAQTALDALTVDERRALFFQRLTW